MCMYSILRCLWTEDVTPKCHIKHVWDELNCNNIYLNSITKSITCYNFWVSLGWAIMIHVVLFGQWIESWLGAEQSKCWIKLGPIAESLQIISKSSQHMSRIDNVIWLKNVACDWVVHTIWAWWGRQKFKWGTEHVGWSEQTDFSLVVIWLFNYYRIELLPIISMGLGVLF